MDQCHGYSSPAPYQSQRSCNFLVLGPPLSEGLETVTALEDTLIVLTYLSLKTSIPLSPSRLRAQLTGRKTVRATVKGPKPETVMTELIKSIPSDPPNPDYLSPLSHVSNDGTGSTLISGTLSGSKGSDSLLTSNPSRTHPRPCQGQPDPFCGKLLTVSQFIIIRVWVLRVRIIKFKAVLAPSLSVSSEFGSSPN